MIAVLKHHTLPITFGLNIKAPINVIVNTEAIHIFEFVGLIYINRKINDNAYPIKYHP
jgi:hypothetical protein